VNFIGLKHVHSFNFERHCTDIIRQMTAVLLMLLLALEYMRILVNLLT